MTDEQVQEIQAALDAWDRNAAEYGDYGYMDRFAVTMGYQAPTWLKDLLQERAALVAVVEAARAFMTADVINTLLTHPMDWADDDGDLERLARLRDALATFGGGEGRGA